MSDAAIQRMNDISEQGLCIGCGLCQAVAGKDRIEVTKTQEGNLRPVIRGDLDEALVDKIYDLCPGTTVRGMPDRWLGAETKVDPVWGPWVNMVEAWARDPEVRYEGATGGVLTALASYLLSSERVAFVLHTKASGADPAFGECHLSFTPADVLAAAGSRYGPTATLVSIDAVLDRNEPFAFVGKPCDIAALRNLGRHDARIDALVKYWLTPVCGGYMPTPSRIETVRRLAGIEPEDLTALRYRGRGCPGPTTIESADRRVDLHYLDFWGEDASQWSLPFRCKICPDGIGEAADIAAADSWPGGAPDRETSQTDPGTNAVVARTAPGRELLQAAEQAGAITLGRELIPDDMSRYQPHQVRKKQTVWPRLDGIAEAGHAKPDYTGLRLPELASDLPPDVYAAQKSGTMRRIAEGKVQEAAPWAPQKRD